MQTEELLSVLAKQLDCLHYTTESKNILNIIKTSNSLALEIWEEEERPEPNANEIEKWVALLTEIQTPIPPQIFEKAIGLVITGTTDIYKYGRQLQNLNNDEIKAVLNLVGSDKSANSNFDQLVKESQSGILKVTPYIGVIFSFILAIKNFAYGIKEFANLVGEAEELNLAWYDTLSPVKLANKISDYQDDPNSLAVLVRTTKSAKIFVDEAISLVANTIDFFKDLIFFVIEIASIMTGWGTIIAGIGDFALSAVIAIIEYNSEVAAFSYYDRVLELITELAEDQIQSLTEKADQNINYSELSNDELFQILETI